MNMGNAPAAPVEGAALLNYVLRTMSIVTQLCSRQKHESGYALEHRTVPDYNFIYVIRGRVVWVIDKVEYPLEPHGLMIVPPGVWHYGYCQTEYVTLGSLHVLVTLPGGQDVFQLLAPPMHQTITPGSKFDFYFRGFMDEFDRDEREARLQQFPGWAHLITRELFRDNFQRGLLRQRASDPLLAALLEDLQKRLDQPVTLNELARRSGFSAQHLNRIFQKNLGTTPLKYLARARMERAAELLRDGVLTIAEVGRRVGYPDPYYFSRQFSAHFRISPSAYRSRVSSENPSRSSPAPFGRK